MNYLAVKDLKAPKRVRETLAAYGTALVTNNGKPMAMLVDLAEGEDPDALAEAIRLARARLTLSALRTSSLRRGLDSLSPKQIDDEIRAVRAVRKSRRAAP
ncbi:MAG: hypothetical protein U1E27_13695 [Kiritimatiellia bacterium]|nr:hypothetical protein [Kiritimatiellia bacterium]